MLIADKHPTIKEKIIYFIQAIATLSPVVYVFEGVNTWLMLNLRFVSFLTFFIISNIIVGWIFHYKNNTFSWEKFFIRNGVMVAILCLTYTLLEMLRLSSGDNMMAEGFKIVLQVSALLYPGSKTLKNIYILSNKQFPPSFVMERLYNFEKTGKISDLFPDEPKNE